MRERLAAFPTHLWLTIGWISLGTPLCLYFHDSVLLVLLLSVYAIVISHWTAHTAWKAERAAEAEAP